MIIFEHDYSILALIADVILIVANFGYNEAVIFE